MPGQQHARDDLLRFENVVQIGPRIPRAAGAGAILVQGARIVLMPRVLDVNLPPACPCLPRAAGPRRQHAVHHIHPPLHRADDVTGLADPHQIARAILGQKARRIVQHAEHRLLPLAHGQPANRIAVKADAPQRLGGFLAQFPVHPALHDPEQRMPRPIPKGIA